MPPQYNRIPFNRELVLKRHVFHDRWFKYNLKPTMNQASSNTIHKKSSKLFGIHDQLFTYKPLVGIYNKEKNFIVESTKKEEIS